MEGKKQGSSSSSSFTSDLFGHKESSGSSSSGIFDSIFAPPSKAFGRESLLYEAVQNKQDSTTKTASPDSIPLHREGKSQSPPKRDMSSLYHEEKIQPCHLSSSIYYGGQDICSNPQSTQNTQSSGYSTFNKDGEDDGSASRGNWWQGSLYY